METTTEIIKLDLSKIRADIKLMSKAQRFYKDQRKTDKNQEARTMSPKEAAWQHKIGREHLSMMYVAYGVLRGKDMDEEIKAHISKKEEYNIENLKKRINKIKGEYYFLKED